MYCIAFSLFYFSFVIDHAKPTFLHCENSSICSCILALLKLHQTFSFMNLTPELSMTDIVVGQIQALTVVDGYSRHKVLYIPDLIFVQLIKGNKRDLILDACVKIWSAFYRNNLGKIFLQSRNISFQKWLTKIVVSQSERKLTQLKKQQNYCKKVTVSSVNQMNLANLRMIVVFYQVTLLKKTF